MRLDVQDVASRSASSKRHMPSMKARSTGRPSSALGLCAAKKASLVISNRWHAARPRIAREAEARTSRRCWRSAQAPGSCGRGADFGVTRQPSYRVQAAQQLEIAHPGVPGPGDGSVGTCGCGRQRAANLEKTAAGCCGGPALPIIDFRPGRALKRPPSRPWSAPAGQDRLRPGIPS